MTLIEFISACGVGATFLVSLFNFLGNRRLQQNAQKRELQMKSIDDNIAKLAEVRSLKLGHAGQVHLAQFQKEFETLQKLWDSVGKLIFESSEERFHETEFVPDAAYVEGFFKRTKMLFNTTEETMVISIQSKPFVHESIFESLDQFLTNIRNLVLNAEWLTIVNTHNSVSDDVISKTEEECKVLRKAIKESSTALQKAIQARIKDLYRMDIAY